MAQALMLESLRIANLGVISGAALEPAPGLTAITGETGAGKTLLVAGLGLLLGERADAGVIRHGAAKCLVDGVFSHLPDGLAARLEELGAAVEDGEVVAARQVSAGGEGGTRSRALLGGVAVPAAALVEVVGELATIHGQFEQVRLGTPERQREMLDRAAGIEAELAEYSAAFARRRAVEAELAGLRQSTAERLRMADMLRFGLGEIAAVAPQPGEDEALAAEARKLQAVDDLRRLAADAGHDLSGAEDGDWDDVGAVGLLGRARKALEQLGVLDAGAAGLGRQAADSLDAVSDLAAGVASYLASLEADPARLEAIAARRAELQGLTRKYGADIAEVLSWRDDSAARLEALEGGDARIADLESEHGSLTAELATRAAAITAARRRAAEWLAGQVSAELAALALPNARLEFVLLPLPELAAHGAEQVQLRFAASHGAELAPLAKVASGGELSRVRLALEVLLATPGHTFVFDEVDSGVGGAVGLEIGARLARLARTSQVVVVTHLAQVAAYADRHYVITKSDDGLTTASDISEVTGEARVAEIARMMGGTDTASAQAHAAELLARATSSAG